MTALNEIIDIFNKYELKPIVLDKKYPNIYMFLRDNPDKRIDYISKKDDSYFIGKYKNRIAKGHYGFAIGSPIIPVWCDILEEIIDTLIKVDDSFEIFQIKIKFGRVCFYVNTNIDDIFDIEILIMNKLFDKALIY